ncbi:MAG: hypothetical protein FJZ01_22165 [Candidatus Sericytochromatia bacterium]|nr:hypothetical protein [Candidatus Tanganyikabacteria bacterium]
MAQRGLLAAVGTAAVTVGAVAKARADRNAATQADSGLPGKFRTFLASYVPASSAPALWSMFARYTTAGRIDLSRTRSLSDLLHKMSVALTAQQATQNKRYFKILKDFREGIKAWERQQAAEQRLRIRMADELRLSEQARERRLAQA